MRALRAPGRSGSAYTLGPCGRQERSDKERIATSTIEASRDVAHGEPPLYTRNFVLAAVTHFTGGMSTGMFILYPLFLAGLGADELVIGQVMGLGAAAAVATRPVAGHLLDVLGARRTLLWGGLVNLASIVLLIFVGAIGAQLLALTVLHAVAAGTLFASYFTYATHIVPPERRIEGVAMFGVAGMLPNGLAPPLSELLIDRVGFGAYFGCAAGFSAVSLLLTLLLDDARGEHPAPVERARASAWLRLVALPELRVVYLTTFLFGVGIAALFTFLAPYAVAARRGEVGGFFFAYAMSAIFTRVVGGRLPERLGPRRLLVPALLAYAVGLALTPFTATQPPLLALGAVCGAGHGYAFPILNVLAVARTPGHVRGAVVSLYTAMIDLGQMAGAPLLGAIAMRSFRAMFLTAAAALVLAALAMRIADRPALVEEL
ncbi:MAG: MFS transporter [Thermodesulfobacteriota bacterium]